MTSSPYVAGKIARRSLPLTRGIKALAAAALIELYAHIRDNGGAEGLIDKMPSRAEIYETIHYYDYEALDETIAKSVVPETPGE